MLLPYNPSRRTAASLKRKKKVFSRRRRQKFTQNCMENRDNERKRRSFRRKRKSKFEEFSQKKLHFDFCARRFSSL